MNIGDVVQSQYRAALEMLRAVVAVCPEELWDDPADRHPFWLLAYHMLFYTHLYLHPSENDFVPWTKIREGLHAFERSGAQPYTQAEIMEFLALVGEYAGVIIPQLDWEAPSGFYWIPLNKLELQFYNIRHLQLHIGELAERLGARAGIETNWVGAA